MDLIRRKQFLEEIKAWREKEIIKVVTGVRRSGKSTLFSLYIDELKSDGVTNEQLVFVNFDEIEFESLKNYKALYEYVKKRILPDKMTYIFLDEAQDCTEFEKAVSNLYLKKNVDIYLTGSNANMLSGDLATKLTARYIQIDMMPLSFAEYTEAVNIADKRERFNRFMNWGAFPYAARMIDTFRSNNQYLEGVYDTVLVRDILQRKKTQDAALLKSIAAFLASNIGNSVSSKKIADTLTSNGRPTGVATVENYLEALCDAYLFYKVARYDIKGKLHLKTEGKYYICDTGLRNMILGTQGQDIGHQIENIAYLELLRRGYTVNIGKSGRDTEIDFVAVGDNGTEYYQVSASVLDENTLTRELTPL
ncbi:MAG: ATP-binding protein, partial [Clostridiales bacterium]|nr:ATP-binding protein [Clostridiales bacterium]